MARDLEASPAAIQSEEHKVKDPGRKEREGSLLTVALAQQRPEFTLSWPSKDWMKPMHIIEGKLLYSKSATLHVNAIQKHSQRGHDHA